jgi:serine/threonine-protein kinase
MEMEIDRLAGTTLGNYEIENLLGRGGMGVVYKARQLSLARSVALKILRPSLSSDPAFVERFRREARAVAQLNHQNIVQIFDIAEEKGLHFFSMEYLEGQTLEELLREKTRLKADEAMGIITSAALAIDHAHQNKITHRDIKPSNIMVDSRGGVKVMDFGLARTADEQSRLTQFGTLVGTLHYMSPERCRGEELDPRSDIYSLGIVFYEMLAGRTPFEAGSEAALIHSIIYEEPPDVKSLNPEVPPGLSIVVARALQKNKEHRYATVPEFIEGVRNFQTLHPTKSTTHFVREQKPSPSIAILPFVNMSADKEQEYFCDGLSEEIINALAQLEGLRVIARTSAFSFKGKDINIREIGRELNVETVLEGSVRKAGNRLRITAQLVSAAEGHHLWSDRYDRQLDDVFAIQDEITLAIVDKLKVKLLGEEKEVICKCEDIGFEAYDLHLRGRYYWNKMTEEGVKKAIEYFEQVVELVPNCAAAYAGLADSYNVLPFFSPISPRETYVKAKEAALKALEIDETLGEAHSSLASILVRYEWNWEYSEREHRRAIELSPGYATAHHWYAMYLLYLTRYYEAIKEIAKAHELDPLSAMINANFGQILAQAGHLDQAKERFKMAIEMDPRLPYAHLQLGRLYFQEGSLEEGMAEIQKEKEVSEGRNPVAEAFIGCIYAIAGNGSKAQRVLDDLLERSKQMYVSPYAFASMYFALEQNDTGFEWLEKAYEERDHWLCFLKVHSVPDSARSDPRFTAMIRKIGLER